VYVQARSQVSVCSGYDLSTIKHADTQTDNILTSLCDYSSASSAVLKPLFPNWDYQRTDRSTRVGAVQSSWSYVASPGEWDWKVRRLVNLLWAEFLLRPFQKLKYNVRLPLWKQSQPKVNYLNDRPMQRASAINFAKIH